MTSIVSKEDESVTAEGQVLKAWRKHRRLTQKALDQKAGLHFGAVGAYERGERRPTEEALARLCVALRAPSLRFCVEIAILRAEQLDSLAREVTGKDHAAATSAAELEWWGAIAEGLNQLKRQNLLNESGQMVPPQK